MKEKSLHILRKSDNELTSRWRKLGFGEQHRRNTTSLNLTPTTKLISLT